MKLLAAPTFKNSPKSEHVKELTIAFFEGRLDDVAPHLAADVKWQLVGDQAIDGKEAFLSALHSMSSEDEVSELSIDHVITHGKKGSVSGIIKMTNGTSYAFADFYVFTSATAYTVKEITSFLTTIK